MIIFTDGSHSTKPQMSGFGAVILYKGREHKFGTYSDKCRDNNVAEIAAIAMSIQYIVDNKILETMTDKTITIISDSETALRKITQGAIGNDEFEKMCLENIHSFMSKSKKKIEFMQIKGQIHDGTRLSYYNNEADILAGEYRKLGLELHHANAGKRKNKKKIWYKKFGNDGR